MGKGSRRNGRSDSQKPLFVRVVPSSLFCSRGCGSLDLFFLTVKCFFYFSLMVSYMLQSSVNCALKVDCLGVLFGGLVV